MIQRTEYLNQLIRYKDQKLIKVVTGVRRCGKSTLFELYKEYLISTGVEEERIISVNLEELEYEELLDYKKLYHYLKDRLSTGFTYIFIDEIQNCQGFEKAVDSLFVKKDVDLYITGSNAWLLSGELATLLSGRYIQVSMLPLSFRDFCSMDSNYNREEILQKFQEYLRYGSFPYITALENKGQTAEIYLEGIYHTILIKDIAARSDITDVTLLENIIKTLAGCIGSPVSMKKISDTLNSSGRRISVNTVERYVRSLTDAFVFYKVDRYDIKGRQYLKTLGKYYLVDTGIRNLLLSGSASEIGHLLENIVYLELIRRGHRVNIGKLSDAEVDFVVQSERGLVYYQVSATVLDENTLKRELAPLQGITDNYPKILLTMDVIGSGSNHQGIQQKNVLDWLLEEDSSF